MKNLELLTLAFLFSDPFRIVGDETITEETDTEETEETETPPQTKKTLAKPKVNFTTDQQAYVNSVIAEERRKEKAKTDKVITQLETLKNQSGTTQAEKDRLELQIEELKGQHLTEKELSEKDRKKADKARQKEIDDANAKAQKWQDLYTKTTIRRSIVDASLIKDHKANNPQVIVSLLAPDTRLVEELDDEGKHTGDYVAKAKVKTVKDGKPVTLDMTVTEAVKFLSEQDEFSDLFNSGASGGLGGNPNRPRKGETGDPNQPPTDPAAYRVWRKANPGAVGASTK